MQNNAYEQNYMCPDQIRTQGTKRILSPQWARLFRAMMREKCTEGGVCKGLDGGVCRGQKGAMSQIHKSTHPRMFIKSP